jgi:hypothetical protein
MDAADHEAREVFDQYHQGDSEKPSADLLSKEEEVFVGHVVQWLRPRNTKDIIWDRVWSLLTEEESQDFYSPDSENSAQQREAPRADGPDQGPVNAEHASKDDAG